MAILRRHLLEKVPVSDVYDEYDLQATVFYHWQKQFFEKGEAAFQRKSRRAEVAACPGLPEPYPVAHE